MTQLFGIVGDPIAQVRSPEVFNRLFKERGIDACMVPMQIKTGGVRIALEGLRRIDNLAGLIITVPHKAASAECVVRRSKRADVVVAVNALRPVTDGWDGDLFDGEGFALGVEAQGYRIAGARCSLVGCGGAGAAIALALAERNVARLTLWDSDAARARALAERLRASSAVEIEIGRPGEDTDIAINATPLGMDAKDSLPFDVAALRTDALVAEAVMKPPVTRLLQEARIHGCCIHEGRHMLDHQVDLIWKFFGLP
jgi:shikimate dehydrogenase